MIELKNATIETGKFVLRDVSFAVPAGQYAVLMGRTGNGKTTVLEAICGLRRLAAGQILIDGDDVSHLLPGDRQIGYVPQDLALFPNLSVKENLGFALRIRGRSRDEIRDRTDQLAQELGIEHLLDRNIRGLSGGEAQRVALGRALSFHPAVLLLDEPLSALDADTRFEMHELLRQLKSKAVTTLHVTHNQEEAEALADCRLLLEDGVVRQRT